MISCYDIIYDIIVGYDIIYDIMCFGQISGVPRNPEHYDIMF